jgi:hypothetical protein
MSASLTSTGVTFNDGTEQNSAAIGFEQTWRDMTGARASHTTYQNTTGRPIQVMITLPDTGDRSPWLEVWVNSVQLTRVNYDDAGLFGTCLPSFIVPVGGSYVVYVTNGGSISRWTELR